MGGGDCLNDFWIIDDSHTFHQEEPILRICVEEGFYICVEKFLQHFVTMRSINHVGFPVLDISVDIFRNRLSRPRFGAALVQDKRMEQIRCSPKYLFNCPSVKA